MGKLEAQMQKGKMSPKRKELLNMREKKWQNGRFK